MARIAIGGFQHETNTFAPVKAHYEDFTRGSGWPGLTRGDAVLSTFAGMNIGIAGAMATLRGAGHELVPLCWAAATPSAEVTSDAFERIVGMLLEDLAAALPVDGIYLDLHGAMVAEPADDGEGEVLRRVRALVGPDVPITASLDLHANVTPEMVEFADVLVAYRTYPHVDMAETGSRAALALDRLIAEGRKPAKAWRQIPFLIALSWQCSLTEPAGAIFREMSELEIDGVSSVSWAPGFPAADFPGCAPTVFAYGATQGAADRAADALAQRIIAAEPAFAGKIYDPDEAVRHALQVTARATKPIIIADTQDNPGAGGTSDTTGMLAALVRNKAVGAVLGLMVDEVAARAAHEAGIGAEITLDLGGKSGAPGQVPYHARFKVLAIGDGKMIGNGPMYLNAKMTLGPMALLETEGVRVVVASRKMQAADQAPFQHVGIEPARQNLLVLKSSVHFRAAFQPIAAEILVAAAPGPMAADPAALPWRRLRPGMRLRPLGPAFVG
ncbi:MAG TPA: M81 family metallopeptidase [Stellaceae bacterium]|nr:M81 family metallopeptidase [Stellaceae bacterium]